MFNKKLTVLLSLMLVWLSASGAGWIRINQLGYIPQATKVAVLMTEEPVQVESFELIDAFTDKVAFSSQSVRATRALGAMKSTYRLDFSDFHKQGSYYIKAANYRSPNFAINGNVYGGAADFVLNYMRQQRCGFNPYLNAQCHQHDGYITNHPTKSGQYLDVRGGWHDAADLLQYTMTSANAIYQMMFAYEQNPGVFGDCYQANGRMGANGIPDIIDEIYWGLDWLDRMNPEKGELYNQIADDRDHISVDIPTRDPVDYGRGVNNGRPVYYVNGEPQQRGKYKNATMGAASTAGKFASDFALGSKIIKPFYPEFAAKIGAKAADAYQVGIDKPGNTQTVSIVSPYIYEEDNWVDDMELGAMELYRMTGKEKYINEALEYGRREPFTPWMGADSARHYQWYPFMNMGHYQLAKAGNSKVKKEFISNIKAGIERTWQKAKSDPFLWGIPGIWCSNNLTAAMLTQCILYRQLSGDTSYEEMEGALRDWLLGCNPWGTSMIVEFPKGGVYPTQPHSNYLYQKMGLPTGGLVDGPVYTSIFNSLRGVQLDGNQGDDYERFQPGHVVFHDKIGDYATNEPTMDGTASLTFPFSTYAREGLEQIGNSIDRNVYEQGGIVQGDPAKKQICLVFTADSLYDGAEKIIKTLKKENIKGSFFFTAYLYNNNPKLIKRLQNDGHYLGSHSYGHLQYAAWENRDSLLVTKEEFTADILRSYKLMAKYGITKEDAPFFMPPFEYYNTEVSSWAQQLGLQVINFTPGTGSSDDYTVPSMGKRFRSTKYLYDNIMKWEREHTLNGNIMLIHFGVWKERKDKLYNKLPQLIKELRAKGYEFVSIPEMLQLNVK